MDETWRSELAEFIAIPSVSADPAHREDVKRAGEWVCDFIRRIGGTAELTPFGEKELALGDIPASTDPDNAPTVLVYGHFDVQPPAPLDLWESDPFELTISDEWAYARGITDDKGQLFILLKAAQKLVEANALPVNLRFACDGEEEIGGHTIVDYLEIDDRGANAGIIFDGGMVRVDVPAFELATRGLIAFDVKVTTGERDLHSGMYGGAALNAIHVLMQLLRRGRSPARTDCCPSRCAQGIAAPTPEELESWKALPSGAGRAVVARRAPARPERGRAVQHPHARRALRRRERHHRRQARAPQHDALGARVRRDHVRLAPGQDVQTIGTAVEKLMRDAAPPGADVDIKWEGAPPGLMRPDSPAIQLGLKAFERVLGVKPLLVRSGGTLPIVPALADRGIATVLTGFALPESNVHSPNEKFLVRYFEQGVDTAAAMYTRVQGPAARPSGSVVVAAGQPRVTELAHRVDDRQERRALLRQLVLDARRRLGIAAPLEHSLLLECAQTLGEGARADAAARLLELREAPRPFGEIVDEQGRPLRADDLGGGGYGTGRRLVDGVHRPVHGSNCSRSPQTWKGAGTGLDLRDPEAGDRPEALGAACRPGRRRHRRPPRGR